MIHLMTSFIKILLLFLVFTNLSRAEEIDNNETKKYEQFIKEMNDLKKKQQDARAKTEKSKNELEASRKLGKTLDELLNKIGEIKKNETK